MPARRIFVCACSVLILVSVQFHGLTVVHRHVVEPQPTQLSHPVDVNVINRKKRPTQEHLRSYPAKSPSGNVPARHDSSARPRILWWDSASNTIDKSNLTAIPPFLKNDNDPPTRFVSSFWMHEFPDEDAGIIIRRKGIKKSQFSTTDPIQRSAPRRKSLYTWKSDGNNGTTTSRDECVPMYDWQEASPLNCNSVHEVISLDQLLQASRYGDVVGEKTVATFNSSEHLLSLATHQVTTGLQHGRYRNAWIVEEMGPAATDTAAYQGVILKTLRPREVRNFHLPLEQVRVEMVAMDRLSGNKDYFLAPYAYCGTSTIMEQAGGSRQAGQSLDENHRRHRLRNLRNVEVNQIQNAGAKLKLASRVARGLAYVHYPDPAQKYASFSHFDFRPNNIMVESHGQPGSKDEDFTVKVIDFNVGKPIFVKNPQSETTTETIGGDMAPCKFKGDPFGSVAPEWNAISKERDEGGESRSFVAIDKTDVFELGRLLYLFLAPDVSVDDGLDDIESVYYDQSVVNKAVTSFLRISNEVIRKAGLRIKDDELVDAKPKSSLDNKETLGDRLVGRVLLYAILACQVGTPEYRPTSKQVAQGLETAVKWHQELASEASSDPKIRSLREIQALFEPPGIRLFQSS